jgi:hypothetical protein
MPRDVVGVPISDDDEAEEIVVPLVLGDPHGDGCRGRVVAIDSGIISWIRRREKRRRRQRACRRQPRTQREGGNGQSRQAGSGSAA